MIGELIAGRHRILRRLARGGMADVFYAKDVTRKCHVAIKFLRSRGPESVRRGDELVGSRALVDMVNLLTSGGPGSTLC